MNIQQPVSTIYGDDHILIGMDEWNCQMVKT